MADHFEFDPWKSIKSDSGIWYKAIHSNLRRSGDADPHLVALDSANFE
jgi:hypothetical protein